MGSQCLLLGAPEAFSLSQWAGVAQPDPLGESAEGQVHRRVGRGVTRDLPSRQDGWSSPAVDRVLDEARARRILGQEIQYIYDPSFAVRGAEATILAPMPEGTGGAHGGRELSRSTICGDAPLLSRGQEVYLFRKMNYLKYRANKLREALDPAHARAADLDEIERLQA